MLDGEGSDNFRGAQRTEHGERGARELLNAALSRLKVTEEDIRSMRQNELKKQAVAWLLKEHSILTHGQIC